MHNLTNSLMSNDSKQPGNALSSSSKVPPTSKDDSSDNVLLPFIDRPAEVEELLFSTPCNASLGNRIRAIKANRGSQGSELYRTLVEVTREELGDLAWVDQIRHLVDDLKPGLWPELEHTLGAEGLSRLSTSFQSTSQRPSAASSTEQPLRSGALPNNLTGASSPTQNGDSALTRERLAWPMARHESDSDNTPMPNPGVSTDYFPRFSNAADHVQGHRHQPSFSSSTETGKAPQVSSSKVPSSIDLDGARTPLIRQASSNMPAGVNTPSAQKQLRNARPLSTPTVDDSELLSPQKSKYSFARTFEGPTLANARKGLRPKAYSMTQYASNVEQTRLDKGREGDIPPCKIAAELEEKGEEKPASLGVLEDGRTKHPFAAPRKNPLVVALHPAVGLTPASTLRRSRSSQGSKSGSEDSDASSSGTRTRRSSSGATQLTPDRPLPPAVHSLPHLQIPSGPPKEHSALSTQSADRARSQSSDADFTTSHLRSPVGGSGFALGGGFFKQQKPALPRRSSMISPMLSAPSPKTSLKSGERKEVSWSPEIYRRQGGFASFSRDMTAAKRMHGRTRSESGASALSTGSQVIASSEGTPISDYSGSFDDNESLRTPELDTVDEAASEAATDHSGKGKIMPTGDLGLDFGDGVNEDAGDAFATSPPDSSAASPLSQDGEGPSTPRRRRSDANMTPPLSPRGLRQSDHIIIPVSPGAERSRSEVMTSLLRNPRFESISQLANSSIGEAAWERAKFFLSHAERQRVNDKQLLETLATEHFGLVDLDSTDRDERAKAEEIICEDLEAYTKRWEAFHELLEGLGVPLSSISEAERRCAPGSILC